MPRVPQSWLTDYNSRWSKTCLPQHLTSATRSWRRPARQHEIPTDDAARARYGARHRRPAVNAGDRRFRYWRDPVCLVAVAAYAAHRGLVPAAVQASWWSGHFTDFLLIPAGLPLWLWLERRIGWRRDDRMPRWREIAFVLVTWTIAAELVAPRIFPQATGDGWDALAYAGGAVVAGLSWQRATRFRRA